MPEPVAEPTLSGLRLNLRIVSVVMFNFASYLTIGLPLAVLPGYVHDVMGFSAFWAGLVISLQYFATLLSRPHAGRYADLLGPKKIVVFGLCGCFLSGLGYLLAGSTNGWPLASLLLLCLGRVILGIGQSFAGTGSTLWGVGVVGSMHIGRVISWNGIVTYGAMAIGAPLGVLFYAWGGLQGLALTVMGVALVAILLALPRPAVKASKGKPLPFRAVLGRVWLYGMALALASAGFGVIATFITLFYDAKGWDGAAFALTLFSCTFVGRDGFHAVDGENRRSAGWGWVLTGFPGAGRGRGKSRPAAKSGRCAGDLHGVYGFIAGGYRAAGRVDNDVGGRAGYLSGGRWAGGGGAIADLAAKKTASGGVTGGRVIVLTVTG